MLTFDPAKPANREYLAARLQLAGAFLASAALSGDESLAYAAGLLAKGLTTPADDLLQANRCGELLTGSAPQSLIIALHDSRQRYQQACDRLADDVAGMN